MADDEQKQINNLNSTIGTLNGDIRLLNHNFDTLNKLVPKMMDEMKSQTKFFLQLIENKDEKYNKIFTRKDINEKENKDFEKRISEMENDRKKVFWMFLGTVILALMNLVIR